MTRCDPAPRLTFDRKLGYDPSMVIRETDETPPAIAHASRDDALIDRECQSFGTESTDRLHHLPYLGVRNSCSPRDLRHADVNNLERCLTGELDEEEDGPGLRFAQANRPKRRIERPSCAVFC